MMKRAMQIIFLVAIIHFGFVAIANEDQHKFKLFDSGEIALEAREMLSNLLYNDSVVSENSGDLLSSLKLIINSYNMNSSNAVLAWRIKDLEGRIMDMLRSGYKDALYDMQQGRLFAARAKLSEISDKFSGISAEYSEKISSAMESLGGGR